MAEEHKNIKQIDNYLLISASTSTVLLLLDLLSLYGKYYV